MTHEEAEVRQQLRKRGVLGGVEPDPDKGLPHKNVRRKCRLLMAGMDGDKYAAALRLLIDVRPEEVLDALITASGELKDGG